MADQHLVRRLRQGSVEDWNTWREKNPSIPIDLSGAHLSGADFSDALLMNASSTVPISTVPFS